ncbi:hypothetical protein [Thioalkalivibrio sp.]|uniref:hypothetical protein n=1 Tax=Thioalkalivibrio sp. TaxID=2093813 RepID=UPI0039762D68
MTEPHPPSGFTLPPRRPAEPDDAARRTPGDLDTWISSQESNDLAATASALLEAMRPINRTTVEYTLLHELTGVLLARLPAVLDRIDAHLRQLTIPLGRRSQSLATAYEGLLEELGIACLRLVEDGLEQGRLPAGDAAPYLRRALLVHGQRCLHLWRLYQPLPKGSWLQMYRILLLAERLGVASAPAPAVEEPGSHPLAPDSVAGLTARIAVLGSAGVYSLQHGEIACLARWLQSVPVQCTAQVPAGADESTPMLRLSVGADHAPSFIMGRPGATDGTRFIDLRPVVAAIRTSPGTQQPARVWHPQTSGLDRHLLSLWVTPPQRRYSREPADTGPLVTVTGLHDIHAVIRADYRHQRRTAMGAISGIQGGMPDTVPGEHGSIPAAFAVGIGDPDEIEPFSLQPRSPGSHSDDDVQGLSDQSLGRLGDAWNDALKGIDSRPGSAPQPPVIRMLKPNAARLRDLGAGGVKLVLQSPTQKTFSGDLIAIRTAPRGRILWQLGMIRWLRYEDAEDIAVGIQYLAPACVPTDIQLYRGHRPSGQAHPGLFFPSRDKPDTGSLLFAPGTFSAGTRVVFRLAGQDRVVTLSSLQPQSHTFSRADFAMPAPPGS